MQQGLDEKPWLTRNIIVSLIKTGSMSDAQKAKAIAANESWTARSGASGSADI